MDFIIGIYLCTAIIFGVLVQIERRRLDEEFNFYQVIVPIFWPIWAIWYGYETIREKISKR